MENLVKHMIEAIIFYDLSLPTKIYENNRNSCGCYMNNSIYLSNFQKIKSKTSQMSPRENSYGVKLYPNSISFPDIDVEVCALYHEIGHAIEEKYRWDEKFNECRSICDDLAPKFLTIYSGRGQNSLSSFSESFAEAFALYNVAPKQLKKCHKDLFHAVNEFYVSFL